MIINVDRIIPSNIEPSEIMLERVKDELANDLARGCVEHIKQLMNVTNTTDFMTGNVRFSAAIEVCAPKTPSTRLDFTYDPIMDGILRSNNPWLDALKKEAARINAEEQAKVNLYRGKLPEEIVDSLKKNPINQDSLKRFLNSTPILARPDGSFYIHNLDGEELDITNIVDALRTNSDKEARYE